MSQLIDQLKSQNAEIRKLISDVDRDVSQSELAKVGASVAALAKAVSAHGDTEQTQLYPDMQKLAKERKQADLSEAAKMFSQNQPHISGALAGFAKRIESKKIDGSGLWQGWRAISGVLTSRLEAEEASLFLMYEAASAKAG